MKRHKWTKTIVSTKEALSECVQWLKKSTSIAVDTETEGLYHRHRIVGVCLAGICPKTHKGRSFYIPIRHVAPRFNLADNQLDLFQPPKKYPPVPNLKPKLVMRKLLPLFRNQQTIFHNFNFDAKFFLKEGIPLSTWNHEDTMLLFYLYDDRRCRYRGGLRLETIYTQLFQVETKGGKALKEWANKHGYKGRSWKGKIKEFPVQLVGQYGTDDVEQTWEIFHHPKVQNIAKKFQELYRTEKQVSKVLVGMMFRGLKIDETHAHQCKTSIEERLAELKENILRVVGDPNFNPLSSEQVGNYFLKLGYEMESSDKGNYVTDENALKRLDHEICPWLMEYRGKSKQLSTYILPFITPPEEKGYNEEGWVYPDWRQVNTRTGRLSSNFAQVFPKRDKEAKKFCRGLFIVPQFSEYIWYGFDLSQIELRLIAHESRDPTMLDIYNRGGDIHRKTASFVFNVEPEDVTDIQRTVAKCLNFAVAYGSGPNKIREILLKDYEIEISFERAEEIVKAFRQGYNKVTRYCWQLIRQASIAGCLFNRFGRKRHLKGIERIAPNTRIQSLGADLIKIIMCRTDDLYRDFKTHLVAQIHDEIIVAFHRSELDDLFFPTIDAMQRWDPPYNWRVPIRVGVTRYGIRWSEETESSVEQEMTNAYEEVRSKFRRCTGIDSISSVVCKFNDPVSKKLRQVEKNIQTMRDTQQYLRYYRPTLETWYKVAMEAAEVDMIRLALQEQGCLLNND